MVIPRPTSQELRSEMIWESVISSHSSENHRKITDLITIWQRHFFSRHHRPMLWWRYRVLGYRQASLGRRTIAQRITDTNTIGGTVASWVGQETTIHLLRNQARVLKDNRHDLPWRLRVAILHPESIPTSFTRNELELCLIFWGISPEHRGRLTSISTHRIESLNPLVAAHLGAKLPDPAIGWVVSDWVLASTSLLFSGPIHS